MNPIPARKLRSDSVFASLTPEQHDLIASWLFDKNLSLDDALIQIREHFNLQPSRTALARFSQRLRAQRQSDDMFEAFEDAQPVQTDFISAKDVTNRFLESLQQKLAHAAHQLAQSPPQELDTKRLHQIVTILNHLRREHIRETEHVLEMAGKAENIHVMIDQVEQLNPITIENSVMMEKSIQRSGRKISLINHRMRPWWPDGVVAEIPRDYPVQTPAKAA